jgi:putative hydrolase of the HAD superfamily
VSYELPTGVRWILLDAVSTLMFPDPPVADVYHSIAHRFGSQLTVAEIRQRFAAAFSREFGGLNRPTSEAAELARWRRVVAATLCDVPEAGGQPFELLWKHFAQGSAWRLYGDAAPVLAQLSHRGYRLGIASNFDGRLHAIVRSLQPLRYCERVFVSSEIGFSKPDGRFFQTVQGMLAAQSDQILLVGDDRINDHEGALAAGWQAVLVHRDGVAASHGHISALSELVS